MSEQRAKALIRRFEQAKGRRANWEGLWNDIIDFVVPSREFHTNSPGADRRTLMFDSTAPRQATRLAAGLSGLLTNPSLQWFSLRIQDDNLNQRLEVRAWLDDVRDKMLSFFNTPKYGFYTNLNEVYIDLVTLGTSVMFVHDWPEVRFQARPLTEFYIEESEAGIVDVIHREYELESRQAVQLFGDVAVEAAKNVASNQPSTKVLYLQSIYPRTERNVELHNAKNMPFASVYIEIPTGTIVRESGYKKFPYLVTRWLKRSNEIYGTSPSIEMLPDIRLINAMKQEDIKGRQLSVTPPLQAPDKSFTGPLSMQPGKINYYRSGSRDRIEPINTGINPVLNENLIEQTRQEIKQGYFEDLFNVPERDRMTATEFVQRVRDKQQLISPIIARQTSELHSPLIEVTYDMLKRRNVFNEPPAEIAGQAIEIDYVSPLAIAQKSSNVTAIQQWLNTVVIPMSQVNPNALDVVNVDGLLKKTAADLNVSTNALSTDSEINAIREQREEAVQAQQQAEQAKSLASAAKDGASAAADLRLTG